jgi:regulator of protease activity HflC (stomatin/prohibitin superfamily)
MVNYVQGLAFTILLLIGGAIVVPLASTNPGAGFLLGFVWFIADLILSSAIRLAAQWERAVVFRLGKYHGMRGPGLFLMLPVIDQMRMVDTRVMAVDIKKQQVITRDNVPVTIDGVLFFRVVKAEDAIIKLQDYRHVVTQYATTSLRDVIGQMTLDELLVEREQIAKAIEEHVEKDTLEWGLEVTGLRIQDIDMPEDLKRMMSRQASAEREKRASITKAEGDKIAAFNLAEAAHTMATSPGAMQLRTLQTIDGLGPSASNTVLLAVPIDVMETIRAVGNVLGGKQSQPADETSLTETLPREETRAGVLPDSDERRAIGPAADTLSFSDRQSEPVRLRAD